MEEQEERSERKDSRKDLIHSKGTLGEQLVRYVVVEVEGKDDRSRESGFLCFELDETTGTSFASSLEGIESQER